MIHCKNVVLGYKNKVILENINLTINVGEFVFCIGQSGSGKSSFIKTLIGSLRPKEGEVHVNDHNLYHLSKTKLQNYRRSIGVIFQDYKLLRTRTVWENVSFALEMCGYHRKAIAKRVPEVLNQVRLLHKKNAFIDSLSGGEIQRIAIARALVHDPDILLGDEPTGNLDPQNAADIMSIFFDLHTQKKTMLIATHDKEIVNKHPQRVISFRDGGIVSDEKKGKYSV